MSERVEMTKEELLILMMAAHRSGGIETLKKMAEDNPELPELASKLAPIIEKWKSDNEELWKKTGEISKRVLSVKEIEELGLKKWLRGR